MKLLVIISADSFAIRELLVKSSVLDRNNSITKQRNNRAEALIWITVGEHLPNASAVYN